LRVSPPHQSWCVMTPHGCISCHLTCLCCPKDYAKLRPAQKALVNQFVELTSISRSDAMAVLQRANWTLQSALDHHFSEACVDFFTVESTSHNSGDTEAAGSTPSISARPLRFSMLIEVRAQSALSRPMAALPTGFRQTLAKVMQLALLAWSDCARICRSIRATWSCTCRGASCVCPPGDDETGLSLLGR
jgi:hypothetical protein